MKLEGATDEQHIIAAVAELRAAGYTLRAIAAELNRQGFTTRNGSAGRHQYVLAVAGVAVAA